LTLGGRLGEARPLRAPSSLAVRAPWFHARAPRRDRARRAAEAGLTAQPLGTADFAARAAGIAVLDVRDEAAFRAGHLEGSGHLPLAELAARRAELPPREAPLVVVAADAATARRVAARLESAWRGPLFWLDDPLATVPAGLASRAPAARLWRPAPWLEEILPGLPRGRAADLAAGAGREAVFLALQGFEVEAWDHDRAALAAARALALRAGTAIETVERDLEAEDPGLPADRYALVACFRFLHRPLLPRLAAALAPGGHLVYETYRVGQERYGRPRRTRFLLQSGELEAAFRGLEILRYEEPEPPGGPIAARLLARRPAGPPARSSA
jgi:rhodanese-related sulfurtransferase